jgi:hypothetical protein
MEIRQGIIHWLLDSDPAIRWQVMKDVLHADESAYAKERARLVHSGWCAQLLTLQDEDGLWNRSLYNGKWISTTYTLYLLKLLGLPPLTRQALTGCDRLLAHGLYRQQEIRFSRKKEIRDLGVSALVLSICCYFGCDDESLPRMAGFLVCQQCDEGSWLPNGSPSAAAYTFETTLIVLEALLQYRNRYPTEASAIADAETKGQEFLLMHNLYLDKGKPIKSKWTSFSFPPYWFYDVLTALDYFRSFRLNTDRRLQPAIDLLLNRQTEDGIWVLGTRHPGKTYFEMERPGAPSRWNTLRALRVLEWWNVG